MIIPIVFLTLTSCSEFLKGKPKKTEAIEIKTVKSECLKTDMLDVKKYFNSEAQSSDIDKTFDCLDKTLSDFQNKVEGREQADAFNKEEITQIVQQFTDKKDIKPEVVEDILKLKAAVIGGSDQKITKKEIDQVKEFLKLVQAEVKSLSVYAKVFTFAKDDAKFSKSTLRDAFAQLNQSLKNLLRASKLNQSRYTFENLKNLLTQLEIIKPEQQSLVDLAEKLNKMLIGQENISTENDSLVYIDSITEVLRIYSVQLNGHIKFEISSHENLENLFDFIEDVIVLFENTLQFKKTNLISYETLDPLLVEILKKDTLPLKLSEETALKFYKTLLVRVFESGLSGNLQAFLGVNKVQLLNLKRELYIYRNASRMINKVASFEEQKNNKRVSIKELQAQLKKLNIDDIKSSVDSDTKKSVIAATEEFRAELVKYYPTLYRKGKIILTSKIFEWDQNWSDLQRTLYVFMLSRELLIGWGHSPFVKEVKDAYVSEQGLSQWYSEFRAFGIETKSFDPRSKNSGPSNLTSANLFTRSGNGDKKMNLRETTELLSILFTGGGEVTREMLTSFKDSQCNLPEKDVFDNFWNHEECVYENFRRNYRIYFSNMNYLTAYLDKASANDADMRAIFDSLIDVVRNTPSTKGRLETSEIRNMATLVHYIESVFTAYDLDKNGGLSEIEIKALYPRFKEIAEGFARKTSAEQLKTFNSWVGTVAGYSCFTEADLIRDSFVFMVYNGKTPAVSDLTVLPCLRIEPLIKFKGEVDRKDVINTFKIVKAVLGS